MYSKAPARSRAGPAQCHASPHPLPDLPLSLSSSLGMVTAQRAEALTADLRAMPFGQRLPHRAQPCNEVDQEENIGRLYMQFNVSLNHLSVRVQWP